MPEAKRVCPNCDGVGFLYNEETFTRTPCRCKIAEYMTKHLGTEIAKAETIYESPLYELAEKSGDLPPLDRTKENLHIKGLSWAALLPHLKLCLWPKGIFFNFRIVTDEKIKTVFVGAEAYNQRSRSKRDDMVTMNSLNDLLGKEYDFVIIRLGFLGHSNRAAAGSVKEALMIRDVEQRPTWVVEEPCSPFGPDHFTYSDDLAEYIDRNYKTVEFKGDGRVDVPRGFKGADDIVGGVEDVDLSIKTPATRPAKVHPPLPDSVIPADETVEIEMPGDGQPRKWKPNKPKWKKRGGGGPA